MRPPDREPSALRSGDILGRYQLLMPIAKGGMGQVWAARLHGAHGFQKLVAVKTILPSRADTGRLESMLFDEASLAEALTSGRVAAAWLDSLEPGALDEDRPLYGIENLQITPRVASTTRESRLRSAWAVARRIDELLSAAPPSPHAFKATTAGESTDLAAEPLSP